MNLYYPQKNKVKGRVLKKDFSNLQLSKFNSTKTVFNKSLNNERDEVETKHST